MNVFKMSSKLVLAMAAFALASVAGAGGTHTVNVSASVLGICAVITASSTLAFGSLNPSTGGTVNATGSAASFRCTQGQTFTITSDDGVYESASGGANNHMRLTGAVGAGCTNAYECIRYTLAFTSTGTGTGFLNNISFGVTGSTGIVDYQSAAVGSYTDTVTLTVSP
jgi:spore coat protein U-like protein